MTAVYVALGAYFLNAVSFIIDKYLLALPIPKPFAYAFWIAVLSATALFLIPFGVVVPSVEVLWQSLLSGAAFFTALIFFYRSVRRGDVSSTATKTGTFTALFTFVGSFVFFTGETSIYTFYTIALFIAGLFFLGRSSKHTLASAAIAGFFFSLSFLFLKTVFVQTDFISGIFWTRMGFVFSALLSLVNSQARREVRTSYVRARPHSKFLFVGNKIIVGSGFLLLYYAVSIGNVSLVTALQGFQYLFLFGLAIIFHPHIPGLNEQIDPHALKNKIIGITFILLGFLWLIF